MKKLIAHLPDSELAVMQALWRAGRPLTRPEIDAGLAGRKDWTVSTVVALLIRLENRGFVGHEKLGRGDIRELQDYLDRAKRGEG